MTKDVFFSISYQQIDSQSLRPSSPTHAHLPSAINISHGKKKKVLLDLPSSCSLHVLSLFPFISKAFPWSFVIWFWPHYSPAPGPSKSPKPSLQTPKTLGDAHLHWPTGNVWHMILSCWPLFSFCALSQGMVSFHSFYPSDCSAGWEEHTVLLLSSSSFSVYLYSLTCALVFRTLVFPSHNTVSRVILFTCVSTWMRTLKSIHLVLNSLCGSATLFPTSHWVSILGSPTGISNLTLAKTDELPFLPIHSIFLITVNGDTIHPVIQAGILSTLIPISHLIL